MSTEKTSSENMPDDRQGGNRRPAPGAALEKRPPAVVATRPGSRPERRDGC